MILNVRILHTDGNITTKAVTMPRYRNAVSAMVALGTRERQSDPTVAAMRSTETGCSYTWTGHHTAQHLAAINASGRNW